MFRKLWQWACEQIGWFPSLTVADKFDFKTIAHHSKNCSVYFSPKGGCSDAIVAEINKAQKEVLVQAYVLTSKPIAEAMIAAKQRGCSVEAILDGKQIDMRSCQAKTLKSNKIHVYVDEVHAIAHSKIVIIDQKVVIFGSYNFSAQAEYLNGEVMMVATDFPAIPSFLKNFEVHRGHSRKY